MDLAIAAAVPYVRNVAGREMTDQAAGTERRSLHNRRTALILLSIALAFFGGVIAKYWLLATV